MSYLVLARKYRPQTFDEVYAQDHITRILKNSIELNRIAHAFLFTGPRGVGKTSMARIFAKSLNCLESGPTVSPCNKCQNCLDITQSISQDVLEIDGASNTGVEDIRELQKELMYAAANSKYKIYIIDEVHMLSKNAFNALLKTLEEPPDNVIFIFATTEPHKVLPTIVSRCQRFDFKRIPMSAIMERLNYICEVETLSFDEDALFYVAKKADGSMRDALSLLDQLIAIGKKDIHLNDVLSLFGIVHTDVFRGMLEAVLHQDAAQIINNLHDLLDKGNDLQEFLNGMLDYIRNLILVKIGIDTANIPASHLTELKQLSSGFDEQDLLYMISILIKTKKDIKTSQNPELITEMSLVKLSKLTDLRSVDDLLAGLQNNSSLSVTKPEEEKKTIPRPVIEKDIEPVPEKIETPEEEQEAVLKVSSLSSDLIANHEELLYNRIEKEKPVVGNYLRNNCKLLEVKNNVLHYNVNSTLAQRMLKENASMISGIFRSYFSIEPRLVFDLKEEKKEEIINNPTLDDIRQKSPDLADFIEATDSIIS